jgi:signal transduction histidine kinase
VVLSTAALAVGLAVGAVVLVLVLRFGLERASDEVARQTAQEVVELIDANRLPDPIPAGGTTLVQVVDTQGRVLAASSGADRLVPALPAEELAAALGGPVTVDGSRFGVLGPVRVVAQAAGTADDATVVVAAPAADIDDAVRVVRTSLIVGFAVLLAVLAAVAWRLVGATLRPVEALRAGAEKITGTGSTDTLPLPDSADEIRRLAETLNDMLGRLESSRRRQRAFVADAAHELRSPLTSLRTQLEVGVATGEEPEAEELLAEVQRLTSLVDDLLLLARLDDAQPPPREVLDLGVVVAESVARYAAQRVPVTVEVSPTPAVVANPGAVQRLLANLLDNAVRYAASAVSVGVRTEADGDALVEIIDDGPGIPAEDRERVFERFSRLHDARDRGTGGSGLGLAIVQELVTQSGGTVRLADAAPDADPPGLRVQVRLPPAPTVDDDRLPRR